MAPARILRFTSLISVVFWLLPNPAVAQSLQNVVTSQGFADVRLQRRFGNHLFFTTSVNGRPAALMLDTSAPICVIHRASAGTFGLALNGTPRSVTGVFGEAISDFGRSKIASLRLGNRVVSDVPVEIAEQAARVDPPEFLPIAKLKWNAKRKDLHFYTRIDPVDGLLGTDVLRRCGAILDCGHQMLYLGPNGASAAASQSIAAFLADRGFARVPMHLSRNGKYEVAATINGHATQLIVDTGSSFTLLGRQVSVAAGVFSAPVRLAYFTGGNHLEPLSSATVKELAIGHFRLENADVNVANISEAVLRSSVAGDANSGLLGIDELSMNFAVIDFGTSMLYLRHPNRG